MNASLLLLRVACFAAISTPAAFVFAGPPSWIFAPSTYTHDPATGARVAQYDRVAPVEDLDDPRMVTSRYRRIRTTTRGADGSIDATYEVRNFGNGRGGLDAEWERFHDAWRQSFLSGSYYQGQAVPYGNVYRGPGFGGPVYGNPGYGYPGYGYPAVQPYIVPGPGLGGPAFGREGFGGPRPGEPGFRGRVAPATP